MKKEKRSRTVDDVADITTVAQFHVVFVLNFDSYFLGWFFCGQKSRFIVFF